MNKMAGLTNGAHRDYLHEETNIAIGRERARRDKVNRSEKSNAAHKWQHMATLALQLKSSNHYKDHINVSTKEDMSCVDCFNGVKAGKGSIGDMTEVNENDEDLLVIHPVADGRLKDEGRD